MLRKIKKWLFQRNLEKKNFFKDVIFRDSISKEILTQWLFKLNEDNGIRFNKFKCIFDTWFYSYAYPINVKFENMQSGYANILITDQFGMEHYLRISVSSAKNAIDEFSIARKTDPEHEIPEKEWHYKIADENKVKLKATFKSDGDKKCTMCTDWKEEVTSIKVENAEGICKLAAKFQQPCVGYHGEEILDIFFNANLKAAVNVEIIFKELEKVLNIKAGDVVVEGFIRNMKCSEVLSKKGKIVKHSYIERINGKEYCIYTILNGNV